MNFSIAFRNLPFLPVKNQVIYIENEYSEVLNTYIGEHIDAITAYYKKKQKEFVYFPNITSLQNIEERVRYYAPYLQSDITFPELPKSNILLQYMVNQENRSKIKPSIIWYDSKEGEDYIFVGVTIEKEDDFYHERQEFVEMARELPTRFSVKACPEAAVQSKCEKEDRLLRRIKSRILAPLEMGCLAEEEDNSICYSRVPIEKAPQVMSEESYLDDNDIEDAIRQLESTVAKLQFKGVALAAIHEMIDKHEKLSRLVITPDYRIFLPDYGNREIKMTILPKAVFFLFLRYPEGIRIKEMPDHHKELYNIYRQLKPNFKEEKLQVTITQLVNPFSNRINEAFSRVRAAFIQEFDEHLAQNYFIRGIAGEEYKITLDRNLIEWQEEE